MNKTEIYEMAMQEMIEENLRLRRKSCTEQEKKQYENVSALAEQVQDILTAASSTHMWSRFMRSPRKSVSICMHRECGME